MPKLPKLVRVFNLLSDSEKANFKKHLSNLISAQKEHDGSYPLLLILARRTNTNEYLKESVWQELYEKSVEYDNDKMDRMQNKLLQYLEDFFAQQHFLKCTHRKERALCEFYILHNDWELAETHLENAKRDLENLKERDLAAYYFRILDEDLRLQIQKMKDGALANFYDLDNILDITFIIAKYRQICRLIASEQNTDKVLNKAFTTLVERYLDKMPHLIDIPALQLYHTAYLMLSKVEQASYQKFMDLLSVNYSFFSKNEQEELLDYAESYFIISSDKRTLNYQDFFAFYKQMDERGILLSTTHSMDIRRYYRAVTVALNTQHISWATYFIEKYKNNLQKSFRDDAYNNNRAKILFEQGEYKQAQQHLNIDNRQNPYITMAVYRLHLKTYWELKDFVSLEFYLNRYKQYLNRLRKEEQLTLRQAVLERNRNFLKALTKINSLKGLEPISIREEKAKYEKKYMNWLITEKRWLLNTLNKL